MTLRIAPLTFVGLFGLVGLNAWLLAVVTADHAPEQEMAAATTDWNQKPLPTEAQPHDPKPISAYGQTLATPVFFKTRLPYVAPPPAPPPTAKPTVAPPPASVDPGLVLGGIMITDGARKAYVFKRADSQGMWLSEGETLLGWKLLSIDPASARLQQAGRSIELQLYPNR